MSRSNDADEAIAKQQLATQLRARQPPDDSRLEVDGSVAQRRAFPVQLLQKAEANPGRLACDASDQIGSKIFDKTFAASHRERSDELPRIEFFGRTQHGLS